MKSTLMPLLLVGWLLPGWGAPAPPGTPGAVPVTVRVVDAVTLVQANGQTVDLLGVQLPQTASREKAAHYSALRLQAAAFVRELADGKPVRLEAPDPGKPARAYIWLDDGRLLNAEIIRSGQGFAADYPFSRRAEFQGYQREAARRKIGVWAPEPPPARRALDSSAPTPKGTPPAAPAAVPAGVRFAQPAPSMLDPNGRAPIGPQAQTPLRPAPLDLARYSQDLAGGMGLQLPYPVGQLSRATQAGIALGLKRGLVLPADVVTAAETVPADNRVGFLCAYLLLRTSPAVMGTAGYTGQLSLRQAYDASLAMGEVQLAELLAQGIPGARTLRPPVVATPLQQPAPLTAPGAAQVGQCTVVSAKVTRLGPILGGRRSWFVTLVVRNNSQAVSPLLFARLTCDDASSVILLPFRWDRDAAGLVFPRLNAEDEAARRIPAGQTRTLLFYGDDYSANDAKKPLWVLLFGAGIGEIRAPVEIGD